MAVEVDPDLFCPPGEVWDFDNTFLEKYTEEELRAQEDYYAQYKADNDHWWGKVEGYLWDDDVPWEVCIKPFQYEAVVKEAIANCVGAAYYAGRRSALGQAEPYWQPPSASEQNQRHNDNPATGSGGEMESVPNGV